MRRIFNFLGEDLEKFDNCSIPDFGLNLTSVRRWTLQQEFSLFGAGPVEYSSFQGLC